MLFVESHFILCSNHQRLQQKNPQQWLQRAVIKSNFIYQVDSIYKKIPLDWRHLAEVGADWFHATFKQENFQVLINADETFIRFCVGLKG